MRAKSLIGQCVIYFRSALCLATAIEQIPPKRVTAANVHHDRIVAPVSVLTSHRFYEEMQGVHPTILNSEARIPDLVNVGKHDRRQLIESDLAGSSRNWSNRRRTSHFV